MKTALDNYIDNNRERFLSELKELLRFPSISSLSERKDDVAQCAEWLKNHLQNIGLKKCKVYATVKHPVVYGEWLEAPGKPTVLIYGHYDVQPVDPLNLWHNPPFEPVVKDNKIYARGSADDKGQFFAHIKSLETVLKISGKLPVNVKVIIEGEEEIGSQNLGKFLKDYKELLKCDLVAISDTAMYDVGLPTICYGLRGLCYCEVRVTGPAKDLHSGSYGGVVANPIEVLCKIVAQLKDDKGRVTIPGFYDGVIPLTEQEQENFRNLPFDEKKYLEEIGSTMFTGEEGFGILERVSARPTLDPNGIVGGFTGEGAKTVIPSVASCKISMRLVPNQNPEGIGDLFEAFVRKICPPTVKLEILRHHGGKPFITPLDTKVVKITAEALKRGFNREPVYTREGGSIPITSSFKEILGVDTVFLPFGLPNENAHSPNENFYLPNFYTGIKTSAFFMEEMARSF
jgi:acetylornithine deacetylase/succinyl-diaminopimelate desuccinylase-like protein